MSSKFSDTQPGLPFPKRLLGLPFQTGPFNSDAMLRLTGWLHRFQSGERGIAAMTLTGADGVGKTRLARHLADAFGGDIIAPSLRDGAFDMSEATSGRLLVVDDAHLSDPLGLFALYNQQVALGRALLVTGRGRVDQWANRQGAAPTLPDLASRLSALPTVEIDAPDADSLARALQFLLEDTGLRLRLADVQDVINRELRRRYDAVTAFADAVVANAFTGTLSRKALLERALEDIPAHRL